MLLPLLRTSNRLLAAGWVSDTASQNDGRPLWASILLFAHTGDCVQVGWPLSLAMSFHPSLSLSPGRMQVHGGLAGGL